MDDTTFYREIHAICGDWNEDEAQKMFCIILDGPQEDGYPEPWFSIPADFEILSRVNAVIKRYYPIQKYCYETWNR